MDQGGRRRGRVAHRFGKEHGTSNTARIIDEGMNRSEVMLNASELMDRIGPGLTNSVKMRRSEDWAVAKFRAFGLGKPQPSAGRRRYMTIDTKVITGTSSWLVTVVSPRTTPISGFEREGIVSSVFPRTVSRSPG